MTGLILSEALATNRIRDLIAQAEADGVGSTQRAEFDQMLGCVIAPQPSDQTSRLPAPGGSAGK